MEENAIETPAPAESEAPTMEDLTVAGEDLPQGGTQNIEQTVTQALDNFSVSNINNWINENIDESEASRLTSFCTSVLRQSIMSIPSVLSDLMLDFVEKRTDKLILKWIIFTTCITIFYVVVGVLAGIDYTQFIISIGVASLVIFWNSIRYARTRTRTVTPEVTEESVNANMEVLTQEQEQPQQQEEEISFDFSTPAVLTSGEYVDDDFYVEEDEEVI